MRKLILYLVLAVTCCGAAAVHAEGTKPTTKDECLLLSKNCENQVLTIQQQIQRLQMEINKGQRVYTKEELQRLNEKLMDVQRTLDSMLKGG